MPSDEELKEEFRKIVAKEPLKHYPVRTLQELGFARKQCSKCRRFFWTKDVSRGVCGEPACVGGFDFIGNSPAKKKLGYIDVWKEYAKIHKKLGYTPINRYPVVARWNPTTEFTIASIAAFQPYVVSGEVAPPANPLVIPQFCLRFPDLDNVGITGHYCGFVMLGEHAFVPPEKYDINNYLKHHLIWLNEGMGLDNEEITIHEDVWAGGGNFGPCLEFFSRGLEISNQVYMQYEATPTGNRELKIKVLDMGQGQERAAWFTQGTATSYDATFPTVIEKLKKATKVEYDAELWQRFAKYAPYLNVQEAKDIDLAWSDVAKKLGMNAVELKKKILLMAGLYAVAEHTRALLVAINDGALPSNVGGMYNLRVILRRAFDIIEKHGWNVSVCDIADWHAAYLKPLFPELSENLAGFRKIVDVEKMKYLATKEKTAKLAASLAGKELGSQELVELYDSQGINPELIAAEAEKLGRKLAIPKKFYALVAARHEQKEQETATEREEKVDFGAELPETKALYFGDWKLTGFRARILAAKDDFVVLDQSAFYPVSGGQMNDTGTIDRAKVVDVFKQGNLIVHKLEEGAGQKFKEGDVVDGKVDFERRKQLSQHHTTTHIVNAAARRILGRHINQASAKKDMEKGYLDVTHYLPITDEELKQIEVEANRIVQQNIVVKKAFFARNEAESKFGMAIYQGGAVPGKELRIVEIPGVDVEACGGTHLNSTGEAETIKLLKTTKVKDGVARIVFAAGNAARAIEQGETKLINEISQVLGVSAKQIPSRAQELFEKWKKARKLVNKQQKAPLNEFELARKEEFSGTNEELITKTAEIINTQPEHLPKTLARFLAELEEFRKKLA